MGEAERQWGSARGRDEICAGTRIVREGGEGGVVASRYPQEYKEGSIKKAQKKKKKKNVVQLWTWAGAQARIALFRIRASGRFQEEEEKKTQDEGRAKIG